MDEDEPNMKEPAAARSAQRVPPQSIDAEESLLGAMLLSEQAISLAAEIVSSNDFYRPAHRHIYDAIQAIYAVGQAVDAVTVAERLGTAGVLEEIGGAATLVSLQASTPAITNAPYYAQIVADKAVLRRLILTANEVAELGYTPLDDLDQTIDLAEAKIFDVAQRRNTDSLRSIWPLLEEELQILEARAESGDTITGTPTGFIDLDEQLLGLQPGALIVIGARPAMGKTAFALSLASHAAVKAERPVLLFSLEMGHLELTERLVAAEARIDAKKLKSGTYGDTEWTKITKAMGRLSEGKLWIDDNPALTITEIRSKARRLQDQLGEPLGLIVIDYLQLMSGRGSAENRQVEVSEISRGLKVLARELGVPVVALSQLSRQLELRSDKRPILADLRESGCLSRDSLITRADTNEQVSLGDLLDQGATEVPVWSLDDDWKLVPSVMTKVFSSGVKQTFDLQLASGRKLIATANHPFRTVLGWRRLDELEPGSRIATPRFQPGPDHVVTPTTEMFSTALHQLTTTGEVDASVASWTKESLGRFLSEVFGHCGSLSVTTLRGKPLIKLTASSVSEATLLTIQQLLLRFDILCRITSVSATNTRWRLWIHGVEEQRAFLTKIGIAGDRGAKVPDALAALADKAGNPNVDTIPWEARELVLTALERKSMTQRSLAAALGEQYCGGYLLGTEARPRSSSRERFGRIAAAIEDKQLFELAESDVFWDEVVSITPRGQEEVFDATVPGPHNFVANGIVVHNSIEQDADVVMFLYRDEVYHPESPDRDTAEVIISKHRAGATGVCRLVFIASQTRFENLARDV